MKKRKLKKWVKVVMFKMLLLCMLNVFIVKGLNINALENLITLTFINLYAIGLTIDFKDIDL